MLPFRFLLITDRRSSRHDPAALLPRLAAAGLRAVQVRERDLAPRDLYDVALAWREAVGTVGPALRWYLNDRADLALALGFEGVHLRADSLPLAAQPAALRERLAYGVSCHDAEGVRRAAEAGAAYVTFGPVFATRSHPGAEPAGLRGLERAVAAASGLPVLALGGVTPERATDCRAAGAHGVAAISAVWAGEDPVAALHAFAEALGGL